jgi:hypothetical protein
MSGGGDDATVAAQTMTEEVATDRRFVALLAGAAAAGAR